MTPTDDLLPTQLYRYVCRCGCGEVFEKLGADIKKITPIVSYPSSAAAHTTATTGTVTVTTSNFEVSLTDPTHSKIEPTPEEIRLVEGVMDDVADQERMIEEETVTSEEEPPAEPVIGDIVWSKATGKGPLVIIAGTLIDVRAARLEIAQPGDSVYIREKTKTDELLRLDAWLVRDSAGRTSAYPKAELTTVRQAPGLSLLKILLWITTFGTFALTGWLLHR